MANTIVPIRCYDSFRQAAAFSRPCPLYNKVSGNVSELGVPGSYKVRLYLRNNGMLYGETWSDATGAYQFNLVPNEPCYVIAFDHGDNPVNAAISDYVIPERMDV